MSFNGNHSWCHPKCSTQPDPKCCKKYTFLPTDAYSLKMHLQDMLDNRNVFWKLSTVLCIDFKKVGVMNYITVKKTIVNRIPCCHIPLSETPAPIICAKYNTESEVLAFHSGNWKHRDWLHVCCYLNQSLTRSYRGSLDHLSGNVCDLDRKEISTLPCCNISSNTKIGSW